MDVLEERLMESLTRIQPKMATECSYSPMYMVCGCTGSCGQSCSGGCEAGCSGNCGRSCSGSGSWL